MGFLGDLREWLTWWSDEARKNRQEGRAERSELVSLLDQQIETVEKSVGVADQSERPAVETRLKTLLARKTGALEALIQANAAYPTTTGAIEGELGISAPLVLELPSETTQVAEELFAQAVALANAEFWAAAAVLFQRLEELDPHSAASAYNRGVALSHLGQHAEALAAYDRALDFRPDDPDTHNNRGAALGSLGRHEEALAACDRALEFRPDYAGAHNNRGVSLRHLGRHEQALAAYDRALEFRPDATRCPQQPGSRAEAPGAPRGGPGRLRPGPGAPAPTRRGP